MNLREYAEQAIPLLQAVLEGKTLEFRPRLGIAGHVRKWERLNDLARVDHLNLAEFEVRVKSEAPDVVSVHVYGDGMVDVAFGPKEPLPEVRGQLVRYVREDLVVWPPPQGTSSPPAEEQEAEEPDAPDYPQVARLVLTPSGIVKVTGPKPAVDDHIAFVERNQGR